jgi:hypothetical protein
LEGALGAAGRVGGGAPPVPASLLSGGCGGGGGGARADACAAALRGGLLLFEELVDNLVPPGFLALSAAAARDAVDAGLAPSGNAAKRLMPGGGARGAPLLPLTGTLVPAPCAPEVLDPLLGCIAAVLARCGGGGGGGALAPPLRRALEKGVAARDALAALRRPLRLGEQSGAPSSLRLAAPLVEAVAGARGRGGGAAATAEEEAAHAKAEVRTLQRRAKREARGAARELKLDRAFLVREADRVAGARDAERAGATRALMAELQAQQATFNQQVGKRRAKPLMRDDPARLPAHLAFVGKTKAQRREAKGGRKRESSRGGVRVGGGDTGRKARTEAKGPNHD